MRETWTARASGTTAFISAALADRRRRVRVDGPRGCEETFPPATSIASSAMACSYSSRGNKIK